jgi:hypothetical protein
LIQSLPLEIVNERQRESLLETCLWQCKMN